MNAKYLLVSSNSRSAWKYLWIFLTIIALAGFSLGQTIAGMLTNSNTTKNNDRHLQPSTPRLPIGHLQTI